MDTPNDAKLLISESDRARRQETTQRLFGMLLAILRLYPGELRTHAEVSQAQEPVWDEIHRLGLESDITDAFLALDSWDCLFPPLTPPTLDLYPRIPDATPYALLPPAKDKE